MTREQHRALQHALDCVHDAHQRVNRVKGSGVTRDDSKELHEFATELRRTGDKLNRMLEVAEQAGFRS